MHGHLKVKKKIIWYFKYAKFAGKKEKIGKAQLPQEPASSLENLLTAVLITNAFVPYRPRSFLCHIYNTVDPSGRAV